MILRNLFNSTIYHIKPAVAHSSRNELFSIPAGGYNPVSYTHLDVYKRQILQTGLWAEG